METFTIQTGIQKTGTTALQSLLREPETQRALAGEGIHVIPHQKVPAKSELALSKEFNSKAVDALKDYLNQEFFKAKKCDHMFLCWENFSGDMRTFHDNRSIVWEQLKAAIPDQPQLKIQLVVFLRRQDAFVQSTYHQYKQQGYFHGHEKLLEVAFREGFDWQIYLNDLQRVFPEAEIYPLPYDPAVLQNNSVVSLVGEIIGSDYLKKKKTGIPRRNVGMSNEAMEIYEKTTPFLKSKAQQKLLRRKLQDNFNKGDFSEYSYLSPEDKTRLLGLYQKSNAELFQKHWREKFGLDNFTPPPRSQTDGSAAKPQGSTTETHYRLIAQLIEDAESGGKNPIMDILMRIKRKLSRLRR